MSETITISATETYTRHSLARALGVSPRTINRRIASKDLPAPAKCGRDPIWTGMALLRWLDNRQAKAQGAR